jgi:hypothetical protein
VLRVLAHLRELTWAEKIRGVSAAAGLDTSRQNMRGQE